MLKTKSPEIPMGFPFCGPLSEEPKTSPMQGRLYISGDPNLEKEGPAEVFKSDLLVFGGVVATAGSPIDEGRSRLIENFRWNLRLHQFNIGDWESMRFLSKVDPTEPMWAKLARSYKRRDTRLHVQILGQLIELAS